MIQEDALYEEMVGELLTSLRTENIDADKCEMGYALFLERGNERVLREVLCVRKVEAIQPTQDQNSKPPTVIMLRNRDGKESFFETTVAGGIFRADGWDDDKVEENFGPGKALKYSSIPMLIPGVVANLCPFMTAQFPVLPPVILAAHEARERAIALANPKRKGTTAAEPEPKKSKPTGSSVVIVGSRRAKTEVQSSDTSKRSSSLLPLSRRIPAHISPSQGQLLARLKPQPSGFLRENDTVSRTQR
jgi:hypothetical protein